MALRIERAQLPPDPLLNSHQVRLLGLIGEGACARVYMAEDAGTLCAAKITELAPELSSDGMDLGQIIEHRTVAMPTVAQLIERQQVPQNESLALQLVDAHPNIIRVRKYGTDRNGTRFVTTLELCEGKPATLAELLEQKRTLPPGDVVEVVDEISSALQYAHSLGLVHNDIKPTNILRKKGKNKSIHMLSDFGIISQEITCPDTEDPMLFGSPRYMSPESFSGVHTAASDQYSLAIMVYELLTGVRPFSASTPVTLGMKHIHEAVRDFVQMTGIKEAKRDALWPVVQRALAKDPNQRFASVEAFATALEDALHPHLNWIEKRRFPEVKQRAEAQRFLNEGLAHLNQRDYTAALTSFGDAIQRDPRNIAARYHAAAVLQRMGHHDKMYETLMTITPLPARSTQDICTKGIAFATLGQHEQALACFDDAMRRGSMDRAVLEYRLTSLCSLGDSYRSADRESALAYYREAQTLCDQLLFSSNNDADSHRLRAMQTALFKETIRLSSRGLSRVLTLSQYPPSPVLDTPVAVYA